MDGDVFSAAVLEKLPLADSVWRLLHFTMDDSWLEDLGATTRTLLRAGSEVQHLGPSDRRRLAGTQRQR